jgi:polyphosphate kinase 2 (PPK2 family)
MKASLSKLLANRAAFKISDENSYKDEIQKLQLKMLTIQQGIWHQKKRAIIVFEGFDAAGKGGVIRRLTQALDPRGVRVHPIGPPSQEEHAKHWLYRFWTNIPSPGTIAIFDRSWYGRVLVERVEKLTETKNWMRAYTEINQFEKMLQDDGVELIKIFLAITKDEQLRRFEARLKDPYKQWKLTKADLQARKMWKQYVVAVDQMFSETSKRSAPWKLIAANDKPFVRKEVLTTVTTHLRATEMWMKRQATSVGQRNLAKALKELGKKESDL